MSEETLEETHDCGTQLVRVSADDPANSHGHPVLTCPSCLEIVEVVRDA